MNSRTLTAFQLSPGGEYIKKKVNLCWWLHSASYLDEVDHMKSLITPFGAMVAVGSVDFEILSFSRRRTDGPSCKTRAHSSLFQLVNEWIKRVKEQSLFRELFYWIVLSGCCCPTSVRIARSRPEASAATIASSTLWLLDLSPVLRSPRSDPLRRESHART